MATIMDAEALYQRGFQLRCDGRYAEAKTLMQQVLAQNPVHKNALHQLGLIQGFEGDFDSSLATLTSLSNKYPQDLEIRYDLAMTQLMLGMIDEGCSNLKYILSIDPTHERALQQSVYCP